MANKKRPYLPNNAIIAFNREYIEIGLNVKEALFLSQSVYWSKTNMAQNRDGWFYKTVKEWTEETGLTRDEQLHIKKKLIEKGFLKVEKRGVPATNYFQVQEEEVEKALRQSSGRTTTSGSNSRRHSLQETTQETTHCEDKSSQGNNSKQKGNSTLSSNSSDVDKPIEKVPDTEEGEEYENHMSDKKKKEAIYYLFSDRFRPWWPHHQEKKAAIRLYDNQGYENVRKIMNFVRRNFDKDMYCPQPTTPFDLEKKWDNICLYRDKNKL